MAHTFKTLPLGILLDRGIRFKKHFVKREYSFGKTAASGPGGLDCHCCWPHMGNVRNGAHKRKMRRYVRRINKMMVSKEN